MNDKKIQQLIKLLSSMPGLGPRSARRMAVNLIQNKETKLKNLMESMLDVYENIKVCEICHNLDTSEKCSICTDHKRKNNKLCIVSDVSDLWAIERSKTYYGKYHILGGILSAIEGITPEKLNLSTLVKKLSEEGIEEVIIALTTSIDGQTTSFFLKDILEKFNVKITTLAQGVPMGGELDYLDDGTLSLAFSGRQGLAA
jgi:recombination protein RecR